MTSRSLRSEAASIAPALTQADASAVGAWWRPLVPLGVVTTLVGLTGAFVTPFLPVFLSQILHASPLQSALFLFLTPSPRWGSRRTWLDARTGPGVERGFSM